MKMLEFIFIYNINMNSSRILITVFPLIWILFLHFACIEIYVNVTAVTVTEYSSVALF